MNHQFTSIQAELHEVLNEEQHTERELRRAYDELSTRGAVDRRIQLVARIQATLGDFHAALGDARLSELERTVTRCFNRLARKEDLVSRIAIDSETMRVTLFGLGDKPVLKSWLSAGEKQIYAVALLWALAQVSGRKLPVIIDTPLGRLDSEHRSNLAAAYFPYAAEQMIILSTDTEIDASFAEHLRPSISREYRLEYDQAESASHILKGYFWQPSAAEQLSSTTLDPGDRDNGTSDNFEASAGSANSTATLEPAAPRS
jgi:DNA sulfur modification protein DndD